MSSGVGAGVDDSTEAAGVGVLTFVFSPGRFGFRSADISSKRGLTTKKKTPAKIPPPKRRKISTPAMIHGIFDFFFATGGNGAEGATAGCGAAISPVVARIGSTAAGGGGAGGGGGVAATGGGGGGGGVGDLPMSEVLGGVPAGPVVGPVLRGNATVAG